MSRPPRKSPAASGRSSWITHASYVLPAGAGGRATTRAARPSGSTATCPTLPSRRTRAWALARIAAARASSRRAARSLSRDRERTAPQTPRPMAAARAAAATPQATRAGRLRWAKTLLRSARARSSTRPRRSDGGVTCSTAKARALAAAWSCSSSRPQLGHFFRCSSTALFSPLERASRAYAAIGSCVCCRSNTSKNVLPLAHVEGGETSYPRSASRDQPVTR